MFKFNFYPEDDESKMEATKSVEIVPHEFGEIDLDQFRVTEGETIRNQIEASHSDLIPSVYEGGFKTWECSHDLVHYLQSILGKWDTDKTTTVLEIGCGSGLPGLELNQYEHFQVDFQDFNREVLLEMGQTLKKNRLFYGDWADLIQIIPGNYYDLLLTSETIYNTSNYSKLVQLFDHALKADGVIYLAAKVYYFGVQGGLRQFEEYLRETGLFTSRVLRVIDANVQREIIEITRTHRRIK